MQSVLTGIQNKNKIEFKFTDFETERVGDKYIAYASLKLPEGEVCIEPLLFSKVYVASYDHKQNLLSDKINCHQDDLLAIAHAVLLKLKEFNSNYNFKVTS